MATVADVGLHAVCKVGKFFADATLAQTPDAREKGATHSTSDIAVLHHQP